MTVIDLVLMLMMNVWEMMMRVSHFIVSMKMGMLFSRRNRRFMHVLMMFIVNVLMGMFNDFMSMQMLVLFREMKPNA